MKIWSGCGACKSASFLVVIFVYISKPDCFCIPITSGPPRMDSSKGCLLADRVKIGKEYAKFTCVGPWRKSQEEFIKNSPKWGHDMFLSTN